MIPPESFARATFWGLLLLPLTAAAQGGEVGAAEMPVQQARELMEVGNTAEACPKFAESLRLDPATGTLLGLAMCHERRGKLASTWGEYIEVQGRAERDGDADRRDFAEQRASELEPRLPTLAIEVQDEVAALPGLEVRRNGMVASRSECQGSLCTPAGTKLRADSVGNSNVATVVGITGTVLMTSGVVMFFLGDDSDQASVRGVRFSAAAGPESMGVMANGTF
jgi:hypothetical protein